MIQIRCFPLLFFSPLPLQTYISVLRAAVFDFSGSFFHVFFFSHSVTWGSGWVFPCVVIVRFYAYLWSGFDIKVYSLFFFFVILALNHSKDLNGEPATVFLVSLR